MARVRLLQDVDGIGHSGDQKIVDYEMARRMFHLKVAEPVPRDFLEVVSRIRAEVPPDQLPLLMSLSLMEQILGEIPELGLPEKYAMLAGILNAALGDKDPIPAWQLRIGVIVRDD